MSRVITGAVLEQIGRERPFIGTAPITVGELELELELDAPSLDEVNAAMDTLADGAAIRQVIRF